MLEVIRNNVLQKADISDDIDDDRLKSLIDDAIVEYSKSVYIPICTMETLRRRIFASIRGLDILEELLEDDDITEIMVNGNNNIYIEKAGQLIKSDKCFSSPDKINDVIQQIAASTNKRINERTPISDTSLIDGSRVNIVLSPISIDSPVITIRKFGSGRLTMDKLHKLGSLDTKAIKLLECLVKSKYNIFVCGGTGSGKTTFLNALSEFIPKDERIITIEDSPELNIDICNLVRLETRQPNTEGQGSVTISDLIRTSLRMRPDRIIVGEVRGCEAIEMLQAMNTGHDGSLSTGHGNSVPDMLSRLETMVLMGLDIPLNAIRAMIASSIDIIIHLGRLHDKSRKVLEITEVLGANENGYQLNTICSLKTNAESSSLVYTGNMIISTGKLESHNLLQQCTNVLKGDFTDDATF
ncbi:MAG: CpaF family protein [Lachnospiraceae bacterium]|nr:CpaF family protein [Lachnospiraceae bacterium]